MNKLSGISIQLVSFVFIILLLSACDLKDDGNEAIPPPNWIKFSEPSPPSFSIWVPKDWEMLSSRDSETVALTAFKPISNPGEVKITVTFYTFSELEMYEYTIEYDQFKALGTCTEFTLRVTHKCIIGPYPATQYYLNQAQNSLVQAILSFNVTLEKEKAYEPVWHDAVRSFMYEQPPTFP